MRAADYYLDHLPSDGLPFWDFDAPCIPNVTPKDSSSATIAASGLLLLQQQVNEALGVGNTQNYTDTAISESVVDLALAGKIVFDDIDTSNRSATLCNYRNIYARQY